LYVKLSKVSDAVEGRGVLVITPGGEFRGNIGAVLVAEDYFLVGHDRDASAKPTVITAEHLLKWEVEMDD
jgi:hypothetical protein